MRIELRAATAEDTRSIGEAIAPLLSAGDAIALTGELGAGKTTFAQGVARGLDFPGHVVSRFELLEHAWDYSYENRSNIIDVYIRYLREKIDRPFGVRSIETVRGAGYRLRRDGGVVGKEVQRAAG